MLHLSGKVQRVAAPVAALSAVRFTAHLPAFVSACERAIVPMRTYGGSGSYGIQSLAVPGAIALQQTLRRGIIDTREHEREKLKLSKVRAFLKEFALLMKEGTRQTYKDMKWLAGLYRRKEQSMFTGFELRERYRILYDTLKFLPFSFFLIVPASELFLPVYLLLFPNSIPTWYIFDHTWDTYIERLEQKQREAHDALASKLRDFLATHAGMQPEDFLDERKYKKTLIKHMPALENNLNFRTFSSDELVDVCKFLGIEYVTGTYILGALVRLVLNTPRYAYNLAHWAARTGKSCAPNAHWLFTYEVKLNFWPFEFVKRHLLIAQINSHIERLRRQDLAFFKFGMADVVGHRITDFARERGITTISCYETLKVLIQNDWVTTCIMLSNNSIIFYAVMQYDFLKNTNQEFN